VPTQKTPIPPHPAPFAPPLVRKEGDREPPRDPSVDPGVTPVVNGIPRGGDPGEKS
jgi:hypothetical protein